MPSWGVFRVAHLLTTALALGCAASALAQTAKPRPPKAATPTSTRRPAAPAKPVAPSPEPAAAAAPAPPPPKPTALRVRSRYTANAQVSENTTYFGAGRQRYEFPQLALLSQCDTGRTIQVSDATRRYRVVPQDAAAAPAPVPVGTTGQAAAKKGGVVTVTVTTTDSGERKSLLGREARHLTIVTERRPDAGACDQHAEHITIDGWYVDLPEATALCAAPAPAPPPATNAGCTDRIDTRTIGSVAPGFALATTATTIRGEAGELQEGGKKRDKAESVETSTSTMAVIELETATVEPGLFDIPAGYSEAQTVAELLGSPGAQPAAVSDALTTALLGSVADGTRGVAPKAAGVVRVGVAPLANTSGRDVAASSLSYNLMASLNKAPYEAIPLSGTTPADLERDARDKSCDYILTSTLTELRSSKPGKAGGLLKKVSGDVAPVGENQDARVDYQLFAVGANQKAFASGSAKASSGGGFGIGSALRVAAFAGQLYMGAMTGMAGMGQLSTLGALGAGTGFGNMGLTGMMMGPGMGAAMNAMGSPGIPMLDQNGAAAERTAGDAFRKAGGEIVDELRKKSR